MYSLIQSKEQKERKKKPTESRGVQEEICMAPSPHRGPGPADVTGRGSLFSLHLSRWRNTSLSSSQGRDGLLCRSSPPSCRASRRALSPVWWISCSMLLSWMIWGIIQKVSFVPFSAPVFPMFSSKSWSECEPLGVLINCGFFFVLFFLFLLFFFKKSKTRFWNEKNKNPQQYRTNNLI